MGVCDGPASSLLRCTFFGMYRIPKYLFKKKNPKAKEGFPPLSQNLPNPDITPWYLPYHRHRRYRRPLCYPRIMPDRCSIHLLVRPPRIAAATVLPCRKSVIREVRRRRGRVRSRSGVEIPVITNASTRCCCVVAAAAAPHTATVPKRGGSTGFSANPITVIWRSVVIIVFVVVVLLLLLLRTAI